MADVEVKPVEVKESEEVKQKPAETKNGNTDSNSVISKLEADIIKQVEYYFGDANLLRDKFLREQIEKNEDSWVTLDTLLTFKRLSSMSTDKEVIVNALFKSDEGLLEISEDKLKVRRHPERPVPEQNEAFRKEVWARSAYVKGFGTDTELAEIIEYFAPFEKVTNIVMRKYLDKPTKTYKFKGSVFVTFATKEQCDEFLKKEKLMFKEVELITKWQSDYHTEKSQDQQQRKNKKKENEKPDPVLPKGSVLHLDGISEDFNRNVIKDALVELDADVAFIEHNNGDPNGYVRFSVENSAKTIFDKLTDGKLKVKDCDITCRIVDGDEEAEFLAKCVEGIKNRMKTNQRFNNKGGRGKRNVHKMKRKATDSGDGETPAKKSAVSS